MRCVLLSLIATFPTPSRSLTLTFVLAQVYYANVTSQLLDLLRSAASSSLAASLAQYAPNTGKGKSRLAPQPAAQPLSVVPAPIIRAAAWCVAHLVVAPPPTRSGRTASQRLLAAVHAPLLPATASAPSPSPGRALGGRPLATHLALVSLLALYAPPLPSLLSTLVAPLVPPLLALVAFLDAPRLVAPLDDGAHALELVVRDEASALLGTWAKSVPAQEAVRGVARAVERWEAGDELTADARVGERAHDGRSAQAAGRSSWKWAWGADGAPELVAEPEPEPAPSEEAGGAGAEFQLRVDAPWLVGWLAGLERKELAAGLFLRWLDEVKVLRGVEGVEGARRCVLSFLAPLFAALPDHRALLCIAPGLTLAYCLRSQDRHAPSARPPDGRAPRERHSRRPARDHRLRRARARRAGGRSGRRCARVSRAEGGARGGRAAEGRARGPANRRGGRGRAGLARGRRAGRGRVGARARDRVRQ